MTPSLGRIRVQEDLSLNLPMALNGWGQDRQSLVKLGPSPLKTAGQKRTLNPLIPGSPPMVTTGLCSVHVLVEVFLENLRPVLSAVKG